jgi:hypothetical protein
MADYADITATLEQGYGKPWRVGDVVAGALYIRDRSDSFFSPSNTTLETTVYRLNNTDHWNEQGNSVTVNTTSTDGVREWRFEPDRDDLWRVVFALTGDFAAKTEITVRVHDPTDPYDNHRPGDRYANTQWGRGWTRYL